MPDPTEFPKVEAYTNLVTFVWKLAGFWSWVETHQPILQIFGYAYVCVMFANCALITVQSACNFFATSDAQTLDIALNVITFVTYVTAFTLLSYFNLYRRHSKELIDYINENFRFHSARGLTNMTMTNSYKLAKFVTISFGVCGIVGGEYWAVLPMISKGPNGVRLLPPNMWYPINMTVSPYYELASASFVLGQLGIATAFTGLGCFYMSSCILVCGQLDLLCCSLRNIRFTAMLRNGVSHCQLGNFAEELMADERGAYFCDETDNNNSMFNFDREVIATDCTSECAKKTQEDLYDHTYDSATQKALKECLMFHQMIIAYNAKFEEFMTPILFGKMVQVTIFLCVILYATSLDFTIALAEYGFLAMWDLYILCFFSNQVTLECDKVADAAFGSPWWCCDRTVTSSLTILIQSSVRPKIIKVMGFYGVTLYTFITVVKASFSYYTVLSNMEK